MNKSGNMNMLAAGLCLLTCIGTAPADEVQILAADFHNTGNNRWSVNVTLRHADSGWDHYADNWRVVDAEGHVLGDRVLYHPHVDEQPFTRGLAGVKVPQGITLIYIESHDKVHGWTPSRLRVDLGEATNGHLRVRAQR